MTQLRTLVDALLVPGFVGTTMPDWLARRLEGGLAGVCWFAHNVVDPEQATRLSEALHGTRDGVLVTSDEEGGTVTRIEAATGSSWPGHAALGQLDDTSATRAVAAAMGFHARAAGIDVVLAPVVDVNSDPANPVVGVRSFGAEPDLVGRHGAAFVGGLQSSGVAACAKHYPGHGATRTDSHLDLPRVDASVETLLARDIAPFRAAVAAGVRCVMTAHVVFPALDDAPATMSPRLVALLREEIGFDGVLMSDALDMKAISDGVGRGAGAVRALAAGLDLLCIGNPRFPEEYDAEQVLDDIADAIVDAVDEGVLSRERLEEAACRVGDLGRWVQQTQRRVPSAEGDRRLGTDVARRVVRSQGDVRLAGAPFVVHVDGPVSMASGRRRSPMIEVLLEHRPGTEVVAVSSAKDVAGLAEKWGRRPVLVVMGHRRDAGGDEALAATLSARPDAVVVYTGLATTDDPGSRVIHCFGGGRASAGAVADLLMEGHER